MGFIEDVKLTLLLTRNYGDQMYEKSFHLPSVKQTARELVSGITTTLAAASESTDIPTRKLQVASTRAELAELKRLAESCSALQQAGLEEAELQVLRIERETEFLEQQMIARRNQEGRDLEKQGLINEAIAAYENLVEKMADTPFTYRRLAILYRKLKSFDNEIRILRAALSNVSKANRKHYDWFKARLLKIDRSALPNEETQAA